MHYILDVSQLSLSLGKVVLMSCVTCPWMRLVQSASIPCVSDVMISTGSDMIGGDFVEKSDSVLNRSVSFDTRRQMWAHVEKQWARLTFDEGANLTAPNNEGVGGVVKYEDPFQTVPLYKRVRSWLNNDSTSMMIHQRTIVKKVSASNIPFNLKVNNVGSHY